MGKEDFLHCCHRSDVKYAVVSRGIETVHHYIPGKAVRQVDRVKQGKMIMAESW